jgi:hypothetical protein
VPATPLARPATLAAERSAANRTELLRTTGWNPFDGRDSDAYSAGEALVALAGAGKMPVEDVRYRHASGIF